MTPLRPLGFAGRGPLVPPRTHAAELTDAMAATLRRENGTANERAAIRCLMQAGFAYGDIIRLCDDALVAARRDKVSTIMREG